MRIATAGDNCIDFYESIGKGYPGGNPVNVAVYFSRLGEKAAYVGVVGDDNSGAFMKEAIAAKGVDVSHVRVAPGKTAITMVSIVDGNRVFGDYYEGVLKDFQLTEEEIEFLRGHDLVHTALWGKLEKVLGSIRHEGTLISFDFADKLSGSILESALPNVDYGFFSYTEDDGYIRNFIKWAQEMGPRVVVATLGEKGSIAYDGEKYYKEGIVEVELADTMGAGDSYIAGFMRGVLKGMPIEQCMIKGAENAAETLKYSGAW